MKIYIATSWRMQGAALIMTSWLRSEGMEVDCFCDESTGRYVFHFSEISADADSINGIDFLEDRRSQKAFAEDKKWLDWADTCILMLPSGRSAHLEAGYAKGCGKKLYIVGDFPPGEFDVMYGVADGLYRPEDFPKLMRRLTKAKEDK